MFSYLLVDDDGTVTGTNNYEVAKQAADGVGSNGYMAVINVAVGEVLIGEDSAVILQQQVYEE